MKVSNRAIKAKSRFVVGDAVRYKPGTYGLEHLLDSDGRIAGTVTGFTPTRVQVTLSAVWDGRPWTKVVIVDATNLTKA